MRQALLILLSLFIFFGSKAQICKSDLKKIVGQWKYLSGSGGFTGKGPGWNADANIVFEFKKNGTFTKFENGQKTESDPFKIQKKTGEATELIYKHLPPQRYTIKGDTLFLSETMADGFQYILVKKRN